MPNTPRHFLALDASTQACSVALYSDGAVSEDFRDLPRAHTKFLLPMVDECLGNAGLSLADLDALAFTAGPGSFTGLRVAAATIQGLAFASDTPVIAISTLEAMAQAWFEQQNAVTGPVLACLDARMDEVYSGEYVFEMGLCKKLRDDSLSSPEQIALSCCNYLAAIGSGCDYLARFPGAAVFSSVDPGAPPRASAVLKLAQRDFALGKLLSAEQAQPVYLRDSVAWKN